jgi:hypothetical protein
LRKTVAWHRACEGQVNSQATSPKAPHPGVFHPSKESLPITAMHYCLDGYESMYVDVVLNHLNDMCRMAMVTHIDEEQCCGFIDARNNGFRRLWLELH